MGLKLKRPIGHGDSVAAPQEWHSSDGKCEMILPHDASWSDLRQDLEDGIAPAERKGFVHGIPDRTLGALIYRLHQAKGDNIVSMRQLEIVVYQLIKVASD